MAKRFFTVNDEDGNCNEAPMAMGQGRPAPNRVDTSCSGTGRTYLNQNVQQTSSMPMPDNTLGPIGIRTRENNMIAGAVASEKRRGEAEEEIYDIDFERRLSQQLSPLEIVPVPKSLKPDIDVPMDGLPDDMKELIQLTAMKINVHVGAVLHVLLGGLFSAARGCYEVVLDKRYKEVVTEYLLVVLPSGGRKSALVEMYRSVFEQVQHLRQLEYNQKKHASKVSARIKKKMESKAINSRITACNPEEMTQEEMEKAAAEIAEVVTGNGADEIAEPWQIKRLLVDSPTAKSLALNMAEQNEAIAVYESEPGVFKNHRIRADQDNIYLKAYSGEPFSDEVTAAKASVAMNRPVLAITICAQDGVAEEIFERKKLRDDGLLPRFLTISCPVVHSQRMHIDEEKFEHLLGGYEDVVNRLLQTEFQQLAYGYGKVSYHLRLSAEAEFLRWQFNDEVRHAMVSGEFDGLEAFGNKLVGHAVRIAGALHLWEHVNPLKPRSVKKQCVQLLSLPDFIRFMLRTCFVQKYLRGTEMRRSHWRGLIGCESIGLRKTKFGVVQGRKLMILDLGWPFLSGITIYAGTLGGKLPIA